MNLEKRALQIVQNFCKVFYYERNSEKSLSFFSEKIIWTGPNKKAEIAHYDDLKAIFITDISLIPSSFKTTPLSSLVLKVTDTVYNINYSLKLYNKSKNLSLSINIFTTVSFNDDEGKIISIKFDYIEKPDYNSNALMQHSQGGLIVVRYINNYYYSISNINKQFSSLFNLSQEATKNLLNKNIFDYMYEEDVEIMQQLFFRNLNSSSPFSCNCRIKSKDKYIWVIALIVGKKDNNQIKYYIIARPTIDLESEINQSILENNKDHADVAINYQISGTHRNNFDKYYLIEDFSDNFASLLNYSKKELIKATNYDYRKLIHPEDKEYFEQVYKKLKSQRPKFTFSYRLLDKENKSIWVNENIEITRDKHREKHIFAIVTQIENLNDSENYSCNKKELLITPTIASKFLIVDLVHKMFETSVFVSSPIKVTNKYVRNIPNSLIENSIIYEDDKKSFLQFFNNILIKQKNSWLGRIHIKNNKIGWYNILSYTLFNNGMPIKALCIIIDVNTHKSILERFNKQKEIMKLALADYEFFGEYDLLTNTPIFLYSPTEPKDFYENKNINNFEFLLNNVIHMDYLHEIIKIRDNNISHIFNNTIPKNINIDVKLRSITKRFNGYRWYKIQHIYKIDQETKHLHLIVLIKNIDEQKRNELALLDNIKKNN